jgi:hypothetical protein
MGRFFPHLPTGEVARPQSYHVAGPQLATIRKRQHGTRFGRRGQNALDLVTAQHWRQFLWFLEVSDFGREIVQAHCDAEQDA